MSRSPEHVPQRARPSFLRRLRSRASEGAIAGALVFLTCLLALRFAPELREAQASLVLDEAVAYAAESDISTLTPGEVLFGEILLVDSSDFRLGYPTFSSRVYATVGADGRKLRLRCRAASAERAVAECTRVVAVAQPAFRLASPVLLLAKAVSPVHWPGVWLAVVAGLGGGFAYASYAAVFRRSKPPALRKSGTPPAARDSARPAAVSRPDGSQPPEMRASSVPAPVHIFSVPPSRTAAPPNVSVSYSPPAGFSRPPAGRPAPAREAEPLPRVEVLANGAVDLPSIDVARRASTPVPPEGTRPIQGHVGVSNASVPISRTMVGWPAPRLPSAPNESLPAPPVPEGPLVHAVAISGGYTPHPRLVQRAKNPTFDTLCTGIAWNAEGEASVVGVIGTADGGAKAAVFAARLAWFLAAPGKLRVLLLEADFEEPAVHRVMGVEAPPQGGFSQQLQARLGPARSEPWRVQRCAPTLDVLVESRFRAHRAAHAPQFEHAVEVFRLHYDVVVAALPPLGVSTGGAGFAYLTDGIVVVVPEGRPMREARTQAVQSFGEQRILAVVEGAESSERITVVPTR